ncbi:DUF3649 domain-containing protein [Gilvimarinus sp. DA14]|uniref:DUF3649 domain-containing protein n=1 Tax=Gilvimarinus sp. DA14 TaxID=2956798 RepID=UPI0020B74BAA|nr:DUF3649 domain-containing protein [Gilvimarinus sp. DA14]UTF60645.1 DUF3649 domain-containing protein [Gilvimarinus sp. DA14]
MSHSGWRLASHIIAALFGGYLLALSASVLLAAVLPASRSDATLVAHLISFAVYVAAIVWAFAAPHHLRAWLNMLIPVLPLLAAGLWLSGFTL